MRPLPPCCVPFVANKGTGGRSALPSHEIGCPLVILAGEVVEAMACLAVVAMVVDVDALVEEIMGEVRTMVMVEDLVGVAVIMAAAIMVEDRLVDSMEVFSQEHMW